MSEHSNSEREELAEKAMGRDPDRESAPSEPWAKTSSGDKDTLTDEDDG
jgi:hypothetical protein